MTSLGIRNNNPGNIELTATRWQGMAEEQTHDRFIQFAHPKWGIRAIARILITYQDKRTSYNGSAIDSIDEIIHRWAPPFENPTEKYSQYVAQQVGMSTVGKIDVYDYSTMKAIVESIIYFENGSQPYDDATIDQGLRLAGIDVPCKSLKKSRTVKAAAASGAAVSSTVILEMVEGAQDMLTPLTPYMDELKYVMLGLTLIATGITVWARIDDKIKEVR